MIRGFLLSLSLSISALGFELAGDCLQVVVGRAESWQSSNLTLFVFERDPGQGWRATAGPWKARCGRKGLAWGRGLHPPVRKPFVKAEGDWRSPAGVFKLGGVWGYGETVKRMPGVSYRRITSRDLWVEDPASSHYNRHLILDHEPTALWEKKAQMRQNDYPHSLKLFIAHNTDPRPLPGAGSSIFFHIWRSMGESATAGCTTMEEIHLRSLIAGLDPRKKPVYVLLPLKEYERLKPTWSLP